MFARSSLPTIAQHSAGLGTLGRRHASGTGSSQQPQLLLLLLKGKGRDPNALKLDPLTLNLTSKLRKKGPTGQHTDNSHSDFKAPHGRQRSVDLRGHSDPHRHVVLRRLLRRLFDLSPPISRLLLTPLQKVALVVPNNMSNVANWSNHES